MGRITKEDRHYGDQPDYGNDRLVGGRTATASGPLTAIMPAMQDNFYLDRYDHIGGANPMAQPNDTPVKSSALVL